MDGAATTKSGHRNFVSVARAALACVKQVLMHEEGRPHLRVRVTCAVQSPLAIFCWIDLEDGEEEEEEAHLLCAGDISEVLLRTEIFWSVESTREVR